MSDDAKHDSRELSIAVWLYDQAERGDHRKGGE